MFFVQRSNIFQPNIFYLSLGSRSAGFLAYLSNQVQAPYGTAPLVFDQEEYDYGDNYNNATGVYTVRYDGLYLFHATVYALGNSAYHYIRVDGDEVTVSIEYDPDHSGQQSSTSIVLHLKAGQEVTVDPEFFGTIHGSTGLTRTIRTSFGATLLYPD